MENNNFQPNDNGSQQPNNFQQGNNGSQQPNNFQQGNNGFQQPNNFQQGNNGFQQPNNFQQGNNGFQQPNNFQQMNNNGFSQKKPNYVPAMVLMIVGLVFSFLIPLVAYVCCIISLVFAVKKRFEFNTKYVIILDIVGLLIAVAMHIASYIMMKDTINQIMNYVMMNDITQNIGSTLISLIK